MRIGPRSDGIIVLLRQRGALALFLFFGMHTQKMSYENTEKRQLAINQEESLHQNQISLHLDLEFLVSRTERT